MTIVLFLLYSLYSAVSGFKDSVLWSRKGADAFKGDEHTIIFVPERIAVFGGCAWLTAYLCCNDYIILMDVNTALLGAIFSFPFFHNGFYYEGRNLIDKAYKGFTANSTTSTSLVNFNWGFRLILFLISTAYLICYEIYF